MKTTWPLLLLLGTLSGCDAPEKREFMRECKAQGNTAMCDCAYNKITARYGEGWGRDVRVIQRPGFADYLLQTAVECASE